MKTPGGSVGVDLNSLSVVTGDVRPSGCLVRFRVGAFAAQVFLVSQDVCTLEYELEESLPALRAGIRNKRSSNHEQVQQRW